VVAIVLTAIHRPTDDANPALLVLGTAVLVVWALVGAAVGRVLPPMAAGVVAWAGGLLVTLTSPSLGLPPLFRVGAVTGSLAGLGLRSQSVAAYLAAYAVMTGLLGLVVRGQLQGLGRRALLAGLSAMLVGVGLWTAHDDQLYAPLASPRWGCSSASQLPQVCLLAGNTGQLDAWQRGLAVMGRTMMAVGLDPVPTYREPPLTGGSMPQGVGVVQPAVDGVNVSAPGPQEIADTVARPSDCPQYGSEAQATALDAGHWLAEYLAQVAYPQHRDERDPEVTAWMARTPSREQATWARSTYERLRTCSLDGVRPPADG
jgi:hypothetical protein